MTREQILKIKNKQSKYKIIIAGIKRTDNKGGTLWLVSQNPSFSEEDKEGFIQKIRTYFKDKRGFNIRWNLNGENIGMKDVQSISDIEECLASIL